MTRKLLTADEVAALGTRLPDWSCDGVSLVRDLTFADFAEAFAFMTSVAQAAESLNHHPDWSNVWNRVSVSLTTHSAGGLTELDVLLAGQIDLLVGEGLPD
ncbi:MAG: 4a-hydroxytetrahydrobiopterin dehydratase [Actinobacteria bacterium]|nr:4a-hydroxytetrahydrobiopterin dehydratase [Actinomycetota bacterium]